MIRNNARNSWAAILIMAALVITGTEIRIGHTQTNLQAIQDRVAEMERKLADAKARQEKAQTVQMQLEEQEQKLAGLEQYLSESDKYRVQVVEIRMNIKSIRSKIETIVKEKNDLEENLRLARDLQAMLRKEQTAAKLEAKASLNSVPVIVPCGMPVISKPNSWKIENMRINDRLTSEEQNEIENTFVTGRYVNQDEIMNCAYHVYIKTGAVLNFKIYSKGENIADLEILLSRRESRSSNYNPSSLTNSIFGKMKALNEFKNDDFRIRVNND